MTEIQKQEFINKVKKLVEGRLVISSRIKDKLREMGFIDAKIKYSERDKIITGQIKYDYQSFDIVVGTTSRANGGDKLIMGYNFDTQ